MKTWLRFILNVNHKLDKMCANIDKKVDRLSVNLTIQAQNLCEEIYDWIDFKNRLINLRVLHNSLKMSLTSEQWQSLIEWRDHRTAVDGETLQKCNEILLAHGYGKEQFIDDYAKNKKLMELFGTKAKKQRSQSGMDCDGHYIPSQ